MGDVMEVIWTESIFLCKSSSLHNLTLSEIEKIYGVAIDWDSPIKEQNPEPGMEPYTARIDVVRGIGFIDILRKAAKDPLAYEGDATKLYGLLRDLQQKREKIPGHWGTIEDVHDVIAQVDQNTKVGSLQKALDKYLLDTGLP